MKHAREDYNRIQDPSNLIPEDEPVFLIRAQDPASSEVLRYYAVVAGHEGASKEHIGRCITQAEAMDDWRAEHHDDVHPPDSPE